ncbi:type VI secretion system protein TssA [Pseudomonas sp. GD03842]|uniref:type VI secretion system protein TssA n=1 Tax=unclassified Pseudomonas TaxID=196821 RepID=UPI000D33BB4D|nr:MULTISPECIES: type VI secretion system protein TssA [unclassified Pseudomonas]MDH0749420.1 type VI secretion system protein TssA [Pseudomonas sp. GD03842]RAU46044.1 type VI secretion system protein TssA [Pseudomonas sp. RIT 409]RAU53913.1 type VI secretion system protein TssA [Pseudomonas sp. RIT 412]
MADCFLLLAPVSASSPCGDNLEYDADFLELERNAQGKPERTMGEAVHPAEPPDWRQIEQFSVALLQRSKDLRITHFFLQSALALHGFQGLANGLTLINGLIGQYWSTLYPRLEADDHDDPTVRINVLSGIACQTTIRLLRESLLTRSRALGPISLRAALHASGLQAVADEHLTPNELAGALRDSDPEHLSELRAALQEAHSTADAIEQFVSRQVGSARGVDLSALKQPLKQALQILGEYASTPERLAPLREGSQETAAVEINATMPRMCSDIANREGVISSLEQILSYYARHEPSSPLPLLLNRAKSLVHSDFAAIVRNLIPDGLSQFENLRGPEAE